MTKKLDANGALMLAYEYDPDNCLTNRWSVAKGATVYRYDAAGNLTNVDYSGGTVTMPSIYMAYDVPNRLTNMVDAAGDAAYSYNSVGELLSEDGPWDDDTVRYTYTNRLRMGMTLSQPSGSWSQTYGYDAAGNLNYRTNNRFLQTFNVNSLNELNSINRSGTVTVAGTTTIPATSVTVNGTNAILYADATFAATNLPLVNGTNTFTAVAWDSNGQVSSNTVSTWLPLVPVYDYDLNGNLLDERNRRGTFTNRFFAYDDENQLIAVWWANNWSNSFVYGGKMHRRIEKDYAWESGAWVKTNEIHFIYDGNLLIQERDADNNPLVTCTRGTDLSGTLQGAGGIGGLLARTDCGQEIPGSPTTAYYHADGNGNVTMLIYTKQIIAAKYLYDPYGNTLSANGPLAEAHIYRFSSKQWDANAGLYYYLYRYYDPHLQRWPNRDPLGDWGSQFYYGPFSAQDTLPANAVKMGSDEFVGILAQINLNLYGAVKNNPNRFVDSYGLQEGGDGGDDGECPTGAYSSNMALNDFLEWLDSIVGPGNGSFPNGDEFGGAGEGSGSTWAQPGGRPSLEIMPDPKFSPHFAPALAKAAHQAAEYRESKEEQEARLRAAVAAELAPPSPFPNVNGGLLPRPTYPVNKNAPPASVTFSPCS